jgi:uncharacterized protein YjiS (DUF1127 family)
MKNLFTSIKENVNRRRSSEARVSRAETRRAIAELRGLSDAQLRDIGIDRGSIIYSVKHGKPTDYAA